MAAAYRVPEESGRRSMGESQSSERSPFGLNVRKRPKARVGSWFVASQVALKAIDRPFPPSIPQASFARSNRQPPRPRSTTFPPARRTARSGLPSPSMSIG